MHCVQGNVVKEECSEVVVVIKSANAPNCSSSTVTAPDHPTKYVIACKRWSWSHTDHNGLLHGQTLQMVRVERELDQLMSGCGQNKSNAEGLGLCAWILWQSTQVRHSSKALGDASVECTQLK